MSSQLIRSSVSYSTPLSLFAYGLQLFADGSCNSNHSRTYKPPFTKSNDSRTYATPGEGGAKHKISARLLAGFLDSTKRRSLLKSPALHFRGRRTEKSGPMAKNFHSRGVHTYVTGALPTGGRELSQSGERNGDSTHTPCLSQYYGLRYTSTDAKRHARPTHETRVNYRRR